MTAEPLAHGTKHELLLISASRIESGQQLTHAPSVIGDGAKSLEDQLERRQKIRPQKLAVDGDAVL
jgi:hypothetical protein